MNNDILEKLEKVSNLSVSISGDAGAALWALSGLLADLDRDGIYHDVGVLLDALKDIEHSANLIWYATEDAKREFEKEDHNTTK
jgi:hypothetical protein